MGNSTSCLISLVRIGRAGLRSAAVVCFLVTGARGASESAACAQDLEAIPGFLLENDAGGKDELAAWGQSHFDQALEQAREDVARVKDVDECRRVLNAYLKAWRKGHLVVNTVPAANALGDTAANVAGPVGAPTNGDSSSVPTLRALSTKTVLLTIASFAGDYREPMVKLIARHRQELITHSHWIIDVRGNDGGDDDTYYPLLSWLMSDYREDVGAEWLATPDNIEGERQTCALYAPGDKDCEQASNEAIARMRNVAAGSYVQQEDGPAIQYLRVEKLEPRRPARVAVLMDGHCASSCEEFLLTVRQSFAVKLIGQPSRGSLDYSNLRPHRLPSGERVLRYAISRSLRLPDLPVDLAGVEPDVYLPVAPDAAARADAVVRVQHWLEGGSLEPRAAIHMGMLPPSAIGSRAVP